jgi:death-on-curing protein
MKNAPIFLSVEHVLAIHERMIVEFGGEASVRDYGLLESAVAMPAAGFGGEFLHDGVPAMAAAYLFHLCQNHPFVDGNKRTAVATAEIFVLLNGRSLSATNRELEHLTLGVADGTVSKGEAIKFFKRHVKRAGPR